MLIFGLLNDPKFWSGLKITFRAFKDKFGVGSGKILVNILTLVLLNSCVLASFLTPAVAEASVFSFFTSLFSSAQAEAEDVPQINSQNMNLLEATPSPMEATTTKDISIVEGTSLVGESQMPYSEKTGGNDQINLYVVHSGDTLPAIAKMFGVSVNTIKWGNDLTGNTLQVGQTLVILPISGVRHTVTSGETLLSIAKKYKGDLDEILEYNNLTKNSKLAIGDVIVIPDGEMNIDAPTKYSKIGVGLVGPSYAVYNGYYMRPLIGGVKTQGIHGHNAVDIAGSFGSNILASADGQVILARSSGWNGGYGSYIIIAHPNGTQTVYGHLSQVLVSVGDEVSQGQVIGKMGRTGHATGVHLHFEIRGARNPF